MLRDGPELPTTMNLYAYHGKPILIVDPNVCSGIQVYELGGR